ncbi:hypothetical protein N7520_009170 [Penicillium odoratum]|uniref:uncharacterized protein n=1 Tax=Penicillium odoratum TaxID=1167516 RepID=UPI0025484A7C|nr:uncharacterized protein N7520_009170 [Penicillium odoratum]KAJ5752253.1 hypothetical protein N7520_009170 [Penicillium odoratum]
MSDRVDGFKSANKKEDKSLISQVNSKLGGDPNAEKPTLADATREFKKVDGAQGFRILMDAQGDTILVNGRNGALYLVGKDSGYDVSAPWGTLDTNENLLTLDVFGRTLSYKLLPSFEKRAQYSRDRPMLADLVVSDPKCVKFGYRATAIKQLEANEPTKRYGIPLVFEGDPNSKPPVKPPLYYPTACKTAQRLEVIATREIVLEDGKVQSALITGCENLIKLAKEMRNELRDHYGVH